MNRLPAQFIDRRCPSEAAEPAIDYSACKALAFAEQLARLECVDMSMLLDSPSENAWNELVESAERFRDHLRRQYSVENEVESEGGGIPLSPLTQFLFACGFRLRDARWVLQ